MKIEALQLVYLWCLINYFNVVSSIPTLIPFIGGAGAFLGSAYYWGKCHVVECCNDDYIKANMTGLKDVLKSRLHGQHLVTQAVIKHLSAHLNDSNPDKALVLSFHGWTGGGKNFVSNFIADHIYSEGFENSQYVHFFSAPRHFPHQSERRMYQDQLTQWIVGNVTLCPRSLFIFDEMDKMPEGLIDTIKPFVDHFPHLDRVDYRKTTFIFLSNTAGNSITRKTLDHWRQGKRREDIALKDMEDVIQLQAYNEKGGMWHAELMQKNLITAYVPFLPLEEQHVRLCVRDVLRKKGVAVKTEVIDKVIAELKFFPADVKIFSKTGCKRLAEKVNFVLEDP